MSKGTGTLGRHLILLMPHYTCDRGGHSSLLPNLIHLLSPSLLWGNQELP